MDLYLDTVSDDKKITISILKESQVVVRKSFLSYRKQAEKLLPSIDKVLGNNNLKLSDIKKIKVNSRGEGFTSLRIGVVTANALAFALNITPEAFDNKEKPLKRGGVKIVKPSYDLEPNINTDRKSIK